MRPTLVPVLFFLMVCIILTAGCGWTEPPGYHQNRDIVVIKFIPNGTSEWITIIDTGFDDLGYNMVETIDGNFIVVGSQRHMYQIAQNGSMVWDRFVSGSSVCSPVSIVSTSPDFFATISNEGEFCRFNSHGEMVWNHSTQLSGSESIYSGKVSGYIIIGNNRTGALLTSTDLVGQGYSPEYIAAMSRQCGNTTPETNFSCNWGNKTVDTKFSANLDREGNVVEYNLPANASYFADRNYSAISVADADVILTFRSEAGQNYNATSGTGKISVPYVVKNNPDGSVVWESRIDLSQNQKLAGYPGMLHFDQIMQTSDNAYILLASVDKNVV
jgi:hypothetical protein